MKKYVMVLLALTLCMGWISCAQAEKYIAGIYVEGEIDEYAYLYDHAGTLQMIDRITKDKENTGVFLYINSPGGYLFESDELYEKLMRYKEKTGRQIYCYVGSQACSGAFYVAMAADYIAAGKMAEIGDVGVYTQTVSYARLYANLGIEYNILVTGENKLEGQPTLTDEQREIVMGRLEEALDFFVETIKKGRNIDEEAARALTDGRIFTATQAKERGLIDAVLTYDAAMEDMTGRFFEQELPILYMEDVMDEDYTYGMDMKDEGTGSAFVDWLLGGGGMRESGGRILALRRN